MRLLPLLCLFGLTVALAHASSDLPESHLQLERWLDERHAATSLLQVGAFASTSASDTSTGIRLARARAADLHAMSAADPPLALRAMKRLEAYRERPAFPAFLETYMEERVNANVQFDVVAFAARRHRDGRAAVADGTHIHAAARARAADADKIVRSITYARADGSSRTCTVSSHGPGSYVDSLPTRNALSVHGFVTVDVAASAAAAAAAAAAVADRKTVAGDACAKSFAYKGKTYTGACTSVDVKKGEWCYLPKGAKGKDGKNWGMCVAKGSVAPASAAAGSCRFVMEETACSITAAGAGRDTASTVSALQVVATYVNGNDEPVSRAFDGGRKEAESWCRSVFRSAAVVPAGPFADTAAYAKFVDEAGIGSPDKLQKWEKESGGSNML
jgi:hypothetical protein